MRSERGSGMEEGAGLEIKTGLNIAKYVHLSLRISANQKRV